MKYEPAIAHFNWRAVTEADVKRWPTAGLVRPADPATSLAIPGLPRGSKTKGEVRAQVKVSLCEAPPQLLVETNGVPGYMPKTESEAKAGDWGVTEAGKWNRVRSKNGRLDRNPNVIGEQNYKFIIPLEPKPYDGGELYPTPMGPMSVAVNGVPIYNAFANGGEDGVDLEA